MKKTFYEICLENNTDKVTYHGYHYFYSNFLEEIRENDFNMLEIGYGDGSSMRSWEQYFDKANIFVADIGVENEIKDRCTLIKTDQSKIEDLQNVVNKVKIAKFIIDDGSHVPTHQMDTFVYLFEALLDFGGIYIIEDIETNYWRPDAKCYGYTIGNFNIMNNMLKFHEMINHEFTHKKNYLNISSITYGQNCIIIKKRTVEEISYFDRSYRFSYHQ